MKPPLAVTISPEHLGGRTKLRLDTLLVEITGETRSFLQNQIEQGRVLLNGQTTTKPSAFVRSGDVLQAEWKAAPPPAGAVAVAGDLKIILEDEDLLVVDKPQGLVVHPAPSHQGETLVHYLLHHMESDADFSETSADRPGIVHRLDKGTSGLMLIAKNRHAQAALTTQFKDRKIKKMYEAVVWDTLPGHGRFESKIGRDPVNRRKMSSRTHKGRDALTDWKSVRDFRHFSHVALFPHTGRTHQLRVHLTEAKHPIVGDPLYGKGLTPARRKNLSPALADWIAGLDATLLHAAQLRFEHPTSHKAVHLLAPRPPVFDKTLQLLEAEDQ